MQISCLNLWTHWKLSRLGTLELQAIGSIPTFPSHLAKLIEAHRNAQTGSMVKPLSFKGDKKPKKRKRTEAESTTEGAGSNDLAVARAEEDGGEHDDSWVSAEVVGDVVGPVMLVLPTEPPTCLACDANGKVFTDQIENIVDANPASAEPHDVRQVWVANKIYGTENYRFKGRYGKYVISFIQSLGTIVVREADTHTTQIFGL